MHRIFHLDIVKLYYLMKHQFTHVLNIMNFQVCVSVLKNISSCQSGHVCSIVAVNFLVYFFLVQKLMRTNMYLPFFHFHHYENISSCTFQKQILSEHVKTCISYIHLENVGKGKVTTQNSLVLKASSIMDFVQNITSHQLKILPLVYCMFTLLA